MTPRTAISRYAPGVSSLPAPSTQLRRHADRLHVLISAPRDVLPESRLRDVLVDELVTLRELLLRHFASEEEGGYLSSLLEARPQLKAEAAQLLEQHTTLRGDFDGLIGDAPRASLPDLLERIATVLESFDAHEHAETTLLAHAR